MQSLFQFTAPPSTCGYLPDRAWTLQYELVAKINRSEYMERMLRGWRRFGTSLFRPRCAECRACRSVRVLVDRFRPSRSQMRARKANEGEVRILIGTPAVTVEKLKLYDRYHTFQTESRSWPEHAPKDALSYAESFVDNPFPTQEWCYYLNDKLIGVGYVDDLPQGLSAIYFFYDPAQRHRSLGTWNVLSLIEFAAARRLPHVYLGYFVEGCQSMEYKARFAPNQLLGEDGQWRDYRK
jgi:arginyl-tRNA--protein-N-Asp/Glu arginylyltransferase